MFLLSNINVFFDYVLLWNCYWTHFTFRQVRHVQGLVSIAFVHIPLEQPVKIGKGRLAGLLLCSASSQRYN